MLASLIFLIVKFKIIFYQVDNFYFILFKCMLILFFELTSNIECFALDPTVICGSVHSLTVNIIFLI